MSEPDKPRVLVVFGTRPEAIKMWPVVTALRAADDHLHTTVCSTGQHRELLTPQLEQLNLQPEVELNVFADRQPLAVTFAKVLQGVSDVIARERPDVVLVQGDVTSSLAAGIAAMTHRVRVAHIEAGLRTSDKWSPYPEELYRRMIGQLADWHFAPTTVAADNLLREGISADTIETVGNTSVDALLLALSRRGTTVIGSDRPRLQRVLITLHRRETLPEQRSAIAQSLAGLANEHSNFEFVWPVHPSAAADVVSDITLRSRLKFIAPVAYLDFVPLIADSALIITDSGGIQEEAAALGTPTLVLRESTCRPESLGTVSELVGVAPARLEQRVRTLLNDADARLALSKPCDLYGDGTASEQIVRRLIRDLCPRNAHVCAA